MFPRMSSETTFPKFIRNYVLAGLVVIVLIYTVGVNFYLIYGKTLYASFQLQLIAEQYDDLRQNNPDIRLPNGLGISSYTSFSDIPDDLRQYLDQNDLVSGKMVYINTGEKVGSYDPDLRIYHVFPYDMRDGQRLFVVQSYRQQDKNSIFFNRLRSLMHMSVPFALGIMAVFGVFLWFIGKKMSEPTAHLQEWAKNLNSENLADPLPRFRFVELNEVARELHNAVGRVDAFVARERDFIRQASHELRTPVTIMQGHLDLLDRTDLTEQQARISYRVRRANRNMRQLIETLLWLGRENDQRYVEEKQEFLLADITRNQMGELGYIIEDKNVEASLIVNDACEPIIANMAAVGIVVSNVIRNAFEHTPKGRVAVHVHSREMVVENNIDAGHPQAISTEPVEEGIGLQLVRKICAKCDWGCDYVRLPDGGLRVTLKL